MEIGENSCEAFRVETHMHAFILLVYSIPALVSSRLPFSPKQWLLLHYRYKNLSDSLTSLPLSLSLSEYDITLMKRSARNDPTNCVLKVLGVLTEVAHFVQFILK